MRQQLGDDAAMVEPVDGRVSMQVGRQQAPRLIGGTERQRISGQFVYTHTHTGHVTGQQCTWTPWY